MNGRIARGASPEGNMERSFGFRLLGSRKSLLVVASVIFVGASAVEACSATGGSNFNTGGSASAGHGTGGTGTSADGVGSLVGSAGSGDSSGSGGIGGSCAASSVKGKLTPLDMAIMLDQSGS